MSHFFNPNEMNRKNIPMALLNGLLRVIDAGGKDLLVSGVCGWEVTGNPARDALEDLSVSEVDVVALWFDDTESDGVINKNCAAAGLRILEAGKKMAIVGPARRKVAPKVQAAATWIIY